MEGRNVDMQTVSVIEGLHQLGLKQIGVLIEGNHLDEAREVVDILREVGVV